MSNPKALQNLERFLAFVNTRNCEADWEDFVLPNRLDLNKKMIARECEFDRKRITENSKIKAKYNVVKTDLIAKGILIEDNRTPSEQHSAKATIGKSSVDKRMLKKSQETNAALEEQLYKTTKELEEAKARLKRLTAIEDYLLASGRL
ncbi:hypothetical protein C1E24_13655 [Pseudoalteromonas phenolica]|uniref:Uncharacterized protein n=1 Tax=Pseudoalteromonas phenolica TaxID=161398 RepID=A0A5R9Q2D5_9GAMM|nr:hypothetical protein [Pseudoalteromonas phenolica]TLX46409.1 hypothetical protein C1E24_13655 [Pseudoalteromonas phenolica]